MPEDVAGVTVNVYDVVDLFAPAGVRVGVAGLIGEAVIAWAEASPPRSTCPGARRGGRRPPTGR